MRQDRKHIHNLMYLVMQMMQVVVLEHDYMEYMVESILRCTICNRSMVSGSIAERDARTLLDEMKTHNFQDRTDTPFSVGSEQDGQPRHLRQLSINSTSDAIVQKLCAFLSSQLIDQVKTMSGKELQNIDIREQLESVPRKISQIIIKKTNRIKRKTD